MMEIKNDVPYVVYEGALVRADRTNRRLWILCIILALMLLGTNLAWVAYESQFEDVTTTITQDVDAEDGGNAIINDGVHINDGES